MGLVLSSFCLELWERKKREEDSEAEAGGGSKEQEEEEEEGDICESFEAAALDNIAAFGRRRRSL